MADKKGSVVLSRTTEIKPRKKLRIMELLNGPLRMLPVIFALIVIWIIFTILNPAFLSARNLTTLSVQIVNMGVMSIGLFLVLLHGELDLSCAAASAVSASVGAMLCIVMELPFIVGFLACILTGILVGTIQGWIVTKFGAPAFIITLGSQMGLEGLLLVILREHNQISLMNSTMAVFTTTYLPMPLSYALLAVGVAALFVLSYQSYTQAVKNNLPVKLQNKVILPTVSVLVGGIVVLEIMRRYKGLNLSVLLLLVLLAAFSYMLTQTRFGVHLYALGSNPEAVRRAGISVKNTKWAAFILSGAVFAFAGLIAASRVQSVSISSIDDSIMMNSIAACVLGGASLTGGKGNIWGVLLGSLVMGSLTNGMYLIGAETSTRLIIQGAILVAAVVLDAFIVNASTTKR
ncbi:MAG TPA: hypothetical protein H9832_05760 [Candidatus Agathobaculum merdavium]|nr:hypothetical protein [Candidatus Agathobaculum merdavium]